MSFASLRFAMPSVQSCRADLPPPSVASLSVPPFPVVSHGYVFEDRTGSDDRRGTPQRTIPRDPPAPRQRSSSTTRLRPPRDVIKQRDRLFYLLQPPLEVLVTAHGLTLPFEPFAYQWEGIAFLVTRHAAVLADEMGLGKTMQAITAIRMLLCQGEIRSVLLVCPKPLMGNWQEEFARWAPEVTVVPISGPSDRRTWQWGRGDFVVKLANYESVVRDANILQSSSTHYDLVILDEAQRIKNPESATHRTIRTIGRGRSWALTGTPVENSAQDFAAICDFLGDGLLADHSDAAAMGRAGAEFFMRRTKDDVLPQLPPKMVRDAALALSPEQQTTYDIAENEGILRLSDLGHSASIQHVLELITRLKQICNWDPATGQSCKLERLSADLGEVVASGRKALIFSQWVGTLTWLSRRLASFNPLEFHGRIGRGERDNVIREFRDSPDRHVLLMSYGCGGVGLNLQFSEYVFLFDRWWNPAMEEQAINRAHRIGSERPVTVTRFLTRGTIEERIDEILRAKRQIFEDLVDHATRHAPTDRTCQGWSRDEIFGLFQLACYNGRDDNLPV